MLNKLSFVAAIAACLALSTAAFAFHGGGHFGGGHFAGGHGHFGGGVVHFGGGRRFWHGRWYNYGVGSCWRLAPDGSYVWICS